MNCIKKYIIRRRIRRFLTKFWKTERGIMWDIQHVERSIFIATFAASSKLWDHLVEDGFTPEFLSEIGISRPSDREQANSLPQ